MNLNAILLTVFVGLFILIGTIIGICFKNNKKFIDLSISIALGVVITLIAFELIPEVLEILIENLGRGRGLLFIGLLAFLGFIVLQQLDLFIPHHEESNHKHKHSCHDEHLKHIGIVTSIALILHNIIEGMSIYITTVTDFKMGMLLCVGVGLHNLPLGLVITSTLINEYSKKKIIIISLIVSLSTFLGGLFIMVSGIQSEFIMGLLLSVTLGMLVYIAFCELLEQVWHIEDKKISYIGVIIGIVILLISIMFG